MPIQLLWWRLLNLLGTIVKLRGLDIGTTGGASMKSQASYQERHIRLFNRRSGCIETERIYGRRWVSLIYGTPWGKRLAGRWLCRPQLSRLYGRLQQHPLSRIKIPRFVRQYRIDLSEALVPLNGFGSFNDFFTRRLKPESRPVTADPSCLAAAADSRLQAVVLKNNTRVAVKGMHWRLSQLLGTDALDARYSHGLCLCFRLAPCDYHRFGYPDDGVQGPVYTRYGPLHSVNPQALHYKEDILATNFRQWCLIRSANFGTLIQVEVGAMMVGSIVQHQPLGGTIRKGAEKGYFRFGGSTVLLILEPGRIQVDADILDYSRQGIETQVRYGETVGKAITDSPQPE
jgi:phosphatidylserine decarboxylase